MIRQIIREALEEGAVDINDIISIIWDLRDQFEEQGFDFRNVEVDEQFQLLTKMLSSLTNYDFNVVLGAYDAIGDLNLDDFLNETNNFLHYLLWCNYKNKNAFDINSDSFVQLTKQILGIAFLLDEEPNSKTLIQLKVIKALEFFDNCNFGFKNTVIDDSCHEGFILSILNSSFLCDEVVYALKKYSKKKLSESLLFEDDDEDDDDDEEDENFDPDFPELSTQTWDEICQLESEMYDTIYKKHNFNEFEIIRDKEFYISAKIIASLAASLFTDASSLIEAFYAYNPYKRYADDDDVRGGSTRCVWEVCLVFALRLRNLNFESREIIHIADKLQKFNAKCMLNANNLNDRKILVALFEDAMSIRNSILRLRLDSYNNDSNFFNRELIETLFIRANMKTALDGKLFFFPQDIGQFSKYLKRRLDR